MDIFMYTAALSRIKTTLLVSAVILMTACSQYERKQYAGLYRQGDDPDNAVYLKLKSNGSYTIESKQNTANDQKVEPYVETDSSGIWKIADKKIILLAKYDSSFPTKTRTLYIDTKSGTSELNPLYGAGWIPSKGYRRISADADRVIEGTRVQKTAP